MAKNGEIKGVWKLREEDSLLYLPHAVSLVKPYILSEAGYTGKRYGKKQSLCLERTLK
jgi:hypothetical protein